MVFPKFDRTTGFKLRLVTMGSSQSSNLSPPGRITIEQLDKESFSVVQVSDNLIRRLTGADPSQRTDSTIIVTQQLKDETAELQKKARDLRTSLDEQKQQTEQLSRELAVKQRDLQSAREQLASLHAQRLSAPEESSTMRLTAVASDRVKQLEQQIQRMRESQSKLQDDLAGKFKTAVDRVTSQFLRQSCHHACADFEGQVLRCYLENSKETLKCRNIARNYAKCVDDYRAELLIRGGKAVE